MAITTPCPACREQINLEDMNRAEDGTPLCCSDCLITGNDETEYCSCVNPNGFKFLKYTSVHKMWDTHQVWVHIKCGGQVIRPLIKSEG